MKDNVKRSGIYFHCFLVIGLVAAGFGTWYFTGPRVRIEERVLNSLSGSPLRVEYALPPGWESLPARSRPGVVSIPPYSIPPEAMEIICVELARRGAACAIPDFFGKSRAESRQHMGKDSLRVMTLDVLTIVGSLRALPFVDGKKIGVNGHSVGGTVAVLAGINDPGIRATAPIGMVAEFYEDKPQNLLFLSGLYDEIHSPAALLDNLGQNGIPEPEINRLYGNFALGTARQVSIIPTTDHFIETFDPRLIRELLGWYARALAEPDLGRGPLREWWRRLLAFLFTVFFITTLGIALSRSSAGMARSLGSRQPAWLVMRLQALPLAAILIGLYFAARASPDYRVLGMDLMLAAVLAQEAASYRARGVLRHGERSPYRSLRGALLVLVALGLGTLLSFGIMSLPRYWRFPELALDYPRFVLNMTLLFPLEVWGRLRPWFFEDVLHGLEPGTWFLVLAGIILLFPGLLMRGLDRLAQELLIAVRARLRPLPPGPTESQCAGAADSPAAGPDGSIEKPSAVPVSPLKLGILALLLMALGFLVWRRIAEGMLTLETAGMAGLSILQFAVVPFVMAWLIIRAPWFKRLSYLD